MYKWRPIRPLGSKIQLKSIWQAAEAMPFSESCIVPMINIEIKFLKFSKKAAAGYAAVCFLSRGWKFKFQTDNWDNTCFKKWHGFRSIPYTYQLYKNPIWP